MCYRKYLQDFLASRKASGSRLSLEALNRRAPSLTKSHLSLIINGRRNLTMDKVESMAEAIGLRNRELEYFGALVAYNQAKINSTKDKCLADLLRIMPIQK